MNTSFKFLYEKNFAQNAKIFGNIDVFQELLINVYSLSHAEYLICTFTSNVCRFIYELMQGKENNIDVSFKVKSLDNRYYVSAFNTFTMIAILDHVPKKPDEIEIKKSDIIVFFCRESPNITNPANLWNGYMEGINQRTNKKGKLPSYKVIEYFKHIKK